MKKYELTAKAFYEVTDILAQKVTPFSITKIVKECVVTVCKTLFSQFSTNMQILDEDVWLNLHETVTGLSSKYCTNLIEELQESNYCSFALDSFTDILSIFQLLFLVKYVSKDCVLKEDVWAWFPSLDKLEVLIIWTQYPSTLWWTVGFLHLFRNDNLLSLLSHQESLSTKFVENCVMKTVVKIVKFLRSNELNHRAF